jgi:hypothetical protein
METSSSTNPPSPTLTSKRKPLPPHWYEIDIYECVLCGREHIYRERRFGPKPADGSNYHYHQDACSNHFL